MNQSIEKQQEITKLLRQISSARLWIIIVCVASIINIILNYIQYDYSFFLSLFSTNLISYLSTLENAMLGLAIAVSVFIISVFFAIWIFSKKNPKLICIPAALWTIDTVLILVFYSLTDVLGESIIEILFKLLVLVILIIGSIAGFKLAKYTQEEIKEILSPAYAAGSASQPISVSSTVSNVTDEETKEVKDDDGTATEESEDPYHGNEEEKNGCSG